MNRIPLYKILGLILILAGVVGCGFAKKEKKAAEAEEQTRLVKPGQSPFEV
jgi:hypothetical protein